MKRLFNYLRVFLRSFPHFILFELIYKLLLIAIGAPLLIILLKVTMNVAGITYLSDENLLVYIQHPLTVFILIVLLFMVAVFTFAELSALIACFACHSRREKITVGGMFITGFRAFRKAFRGVGIPRFLIFMAFMPIAQFTLASGQFMAPLLPILKTIFSPVSGAAGVAAYILIQVLFVMLIVNRSYSLHFLILTKNKFSESTKKSEMLIKGKKIKMALSLFFWSLFTISAAAIFTFGIGFIVSYIIKGFSEPAKAFRLALRIFRYAIRVFQAVSSFFSAPIIICWLTGRFLEDIEGKEEVDLPDIKSLKMSRLPKTMLISGIIISGLGLNLTYLQSLRSGNISLNVGILTRTQVTAHRGFSYVAPENTAYAFEKAIESGADYIELDVQLTKDDQLVVFHDKKIDRTTDGEGELSQYTYAELQQFSAGSWFGEEFQDAEIMLLSDVIELIGDDIMLNIEIKKHNRIPETAAKTVEVIQEYGIEKTCYVTSFSYSALKTVKSLDSKIKTGLIANVASSASFTKLKYIDAVSLNYLLVNQSVVNTAHQNGKRIMVWTVDRQADIQHMISLGVDNIITNRPDLAEEIIDSKTVGDTILTILENVFGG